MWNPEYGRPYTQIGRPHDAPWTSWEFTHIARMHCWYEDFLATLAHRVLFSDTDAFTTAVFHEVYLGTPATGFEDLVDRPYDLFVVCGLDVPWRHDGIREFEEQRRWMHERYLEHARTSGRPWLLVEGPLEQRIEDAADAVDELLAARRGLGADRRALDGRPRYSALGNDGRSRVTKLARSWHGLVANSGDGNDRIGSGWWDGVPRRGRPREERVETREPPDEALSARSGARPSSAP